MSNRHWQKDSVNLGNLTDQAKNQIFAEIAKISPRLAQQLAGLDWNGINLSLAKAALKQAAKKLGAKLVTSGKDRSGNRFVTAIKHSGGGSYDSITYALFQKPDGSLCVEFEQYDHIGERVKDQVRKAFEAAYRTLANKAMLELLSVSGQVKVTQQEDGQVTMVAELEVN
jgi:hypothetical protein